MSGRWYSTGWYCTCGGREGKRPHGQDCPHRERSTGEINHQMDCITRSLARIETTLSLLAATPTNQAGG